MIWSWVKGYEGMYSVSSTGLVKSLPKWSGNSFRVEKILKPKIKKNGYLQVTLCGVGGKKIKYVHRLVAEVFVPNPDNLPQVNHKDGNKQNNHFENLEWCDNSKNISHAYGTGLCPKGEQHHQSKLSAADVNFIRQHYIPRHPIYGGSALGRRFGVKQCTISAIITNRNWKGDVM